MKQFVFFIMLITAQSVCYAQSHPKVDSLFHYLKEIGVVNACEYNNFRQYGLLMSFGISCDVVPGIDKMSSYELAERHLRKNSLLHWGHVVADIHCVKNCEKGAVVPVTVIFVGVFV